MMRRLLIVSPHFSPTNAADMHRVRTVLPFLRENQWQAEVLAVAPECVAAPVDEWLTAGIPHDVVIHRAPALSLRWSRIPGFGTLDLRARVALQRAGERILTAKQFDLIYFSTTVFGIHVLGPKWKKKFGVPFVLDYQDPWVSDYYRNHPDVKPPGGRVKYWVVDRIARRQEPRVLAECAGITAVSSAYPEQLQQRYPALPKLPVMIAPFPGSKRDFERAGNQAIHQHCFDPRDGKRHWVYVGVSGPIMFKVLRAFFSSVARHLKSEPAFARRLNMHFIGTSYAPAGTAQPVVQPLAAEFGLGALVHEQTARVPYSQALRCLLDANALLVPGSDDPAYNASKLFPYLLAKKPTLAMFHEDSPVTGLVQRVGGAALVSFRNDETETQISERITQAWFSDRNYEQVVATSQDEFDEFTDRGQARRLCEFFDRIVENLD